MEQAICPEQDLSSQHHESCDTKPSQQPRCIDSGGILLCFDMQWVPFPCYQRAWNPICWQFGTCSWLVTSCSGWVCFFQCGGIVFQRNSHKQLSSMRMTCPAPLHRQIFLVEYRMWVRKWKHCSLGSSTEVPTRIVDTLQQCDETEFPNIFVLLKLALTLPISNCESERRFSQLQLTKKLTREKCDSIWQCPQERKSLVTSFSMLNPRRMKLPFVLADKD